MQAEQPKASVTASLAIGGRDLDPGAVSQAAGREPTEVWRQRLNALKNDPRLAQVEWVYELVRRPHWSIDEAIGEMLDVFEERREQIVSFAQQHDLSLHLRLGLHGDETVIVYAIETPTIERLAAFRCSLSFWIDDDPTESVGVPLSGDDLAFLRYTIEETWRALGDVGAAFLARTGEGRERACEIRARLEGRLSASERHYCRSAEARTPLPFPIHLDELRFLISSTRQTLSALGQQEFETKTGESPERAKEILAELETALPGQVPRRHNGGMAEPFTVPLSAADLAFLLHVIEATIAAPRQVPAQFHSGIDKIADALLVRFGDAMRQRGWRSPFPVSLRLGELRFLVRTISETLAAIEEREFRARAGVSPERAKELRARFERILRESERD